MAIVWIDGFDHYRSTSGNITNYTGAYEPPGNANNFRYATNGVVGGCMQTGAATGTNGPIKALPNADRYGVGFHFQVAASSLSSDNYGVIQFRSSGTIIATVTVNTNGEFQIRTGGTGGTVVATSQSFPFQTWYHLEFAVTRGNDGAYELRLNGQTILSGTANFSNNPINQLYIGSFGIAASTDFRYDNLFVWDTTGDTNNDFLGEQNVFTLLPDSDQSPNEWVPVGVANGWQALANVPGTEDEYVAAATVGDTSLYGIEDIPSADIGVIAVQANIRAQKDGSEPADVEFGVVSNGNEDTSVVIMTQDQYHWFAHLMESDPNGDVPWDPEAVDDLNLVLRRAA